MRGRVPFRVVSGAVGPVSLVRVIDVTATECDTLLFLLNRERDAVIRISEDLPEAVVRTPGVPSGTNLLGLIRHLTAMEVRWFQQIFLGGPGDDDGSMRVPAGVSREEVVAAYRRACARSDQIAAECRDLSTLSTETARLPASTSRDADPGESGRVSLRMVIAHMLEETSRHAGHADILRELIDGETDL